MFRIKVRSLRNLILAGVALAIAAGAAYAAVNETITGTLTVQGSTTPSGSTVYAAGTTALAPSKDVTGVLNTTAAAGAHEYDGTAFYDTPVASTRGVRDVEHLVALSTNFTLTDANTAQPAFNATAAGAITLPGATTYEFEFSYLITNTGTTSHTWAVLFGGTATLTSGAMQCVAISATSSAVTAALQGYTTTLGTAFVVTAASTSATENVTISCKGVARINAGGTLIPQVKLSAASTGTETMLANSYLRMWAVGSNTVTNVGNWN